MKFSSITLLATLFLSGTAVSAAEAEGFLRQGAAAVAAADETETYVPCLTKDDLSFEEILVENENEFTRCKSTYLNQIKNKMKELGREKCNMGDNRFGRELEYWFDKGSFNNYGQYFNDVCKRALQAQEEMAYTFSADVITNATRYLDVAEFYDGRTYLNEEIGDLSNGDGQFIKDFYTYHAQNSLVEFPDELLQFKGCKANAIKCCWVQDRHNENAQNNGNCRADADGVYRNGCIDRDPADNTDICYVDMQENRRHNHVAGGKAIFHDFDLADDDDETEGRAHCHAFAWKNSGESPSNRYRGNMLFYVSMYDHLYQRGYIRNVPGAAMCSCVERAPVVTRSDCTQLAIEETYTFEYNDGDKKLHATIQDVDISFDTCTGPDDDSNDDDNDLAQHVERLVEQGDIKESEQELLLETVVGEDNCPGAIEEFMREHGWVRAPAAEA